MARLGWIAAGWVFVSLGAIGAFLPVMPTTCFLIGALACFTRGSPRLARRLLDHPRFGPGLRAWQANRSIPTHVKCVSVGSILVAWLLLFALVDSALVVAGTGLVLLVVSGYILSRPVATTV